jgi:peptidoglycan biosynthesis protein MviN/MurJ (putative lipid II flippase)
LVVLYQRGAFDSSDVELTLLIYQVLTIGFLPGLMFNFLTRTMFIESEIRHLFWVITCKSIFEIIFMTLFIHSFFMTIPVVLTISKFVCVLYLYLYLNKKKSGIFNARRAFKLYSVAIFLSLIIFFLNQEVVKKVTSMPIYELAIYYTPIFLMTLILSFYFLKNLKKKVISA